MRWAWVVSLFMWFGAAALACHPVEGDHISGEDLSKADPWFAALDPDLKIAPTPLPGVPRLFHGAELARLGQMHGIALPAPVSEQCFERATEPLTVEQLLPVLQTALGMDDARMIIQDFSRAGVPKGTLEFRRSGLTASGLWRGQVVYAEARSVPVWAQVRVSVERTWVEAIETLPAGKPIVRAQLVERRGPRFLFAAMPLDTIDLAAGREPIHAIKPGEPIFGSMLIAPREVERGDQVNVVVQSGEARLQLWAEAETSGRFGELVMVRNPDSGRHFQARVEGKDKVLITR